MKQSIILDSSCLVAFISTQDTHHHWVTEQLASISPPLLTCEAVISETCFLVSRYDQKKVQEVMRLLRIGLVTISFQLPQEIEKIEQLLKKYVNVPMSFADACLVRLAENYPYSAILTLDHDFTIYRKHGNQVIPVIMP